ncbi:hypothetical protein SAMN05444159_2233 [Bradyrhizobium lablabi]|uniref:Uncharacterized protein n=1 Tax=Bradyrhizobium lablabi TaxID=722472 RepID=A0A1M6P5U1_9BRAD|nr:hypothetical protein SAMN05444159_2233 [Bradyrhizobium lablabi]
MAQTRQESGNGYVFNTSLVYYSFTLPSAQCAIGLSLRILSKVCAGSITARVPPHRSEGTIDCIHPFNAFLTLTAVTKW